MLLAWILAATIALRPVLDPPATSTQAWFGGRVYTSDALHVGVRPAAFLTVDGGGLSAGIAVTVQLTGNFP